MKLKKCSLFLVAAVLCTVLPLNSCSDEDRDAMLPAGDLLQNREVDVVYNKLFHQVNVADLPNSKLRLNTLSKLDITLPDSCPLKFAVEMTGEGPYLVPSLRSTMKKKLMVVPVKIGLKANPALSRTVFLSIVNEGPETKAGEEYTPSDARFSVYQEVMGKGVDCWGVIGGTKESPVMLYSRMDNLDDRYINVNSNITNTDMLEVQTAGYDSCMSSYAFNIGLAASHTMTFANPFKQLATAVVNGLHTAPDIPKEKHTLSGNVNFGMENAGFSSQDYEIYMNLYKVEKAEVALDMQRFEWSKANRKPDHLLPGLLNDQFMDNLCVAPRDFSPEAFYERWGTDVITSGTFGGYYLYMYGRQKNVYSHSMSIDVSAALKASNPNYATDPDHPWAAIYNNKENSNFIQLEGDFDHMDAAYSSASRAVTYMHSEGGNANFSDGQVWIDGFNDINQSDKWNLISYRRKDDKDQPEDSVSLLYPVEQVAINAVGIYLYYHRDLSWADSVAVSQVGTNLDNLCAARHDYIQSHTTHTRESVPMVVADFLMQNSANGHKENRKQKVMAGPDRVNRIYHPLVVNKGAPGDEKEGGYLETSSHNYINNVNDQTDQIWWVALDYQDQCTPLKSICFMDEGEEAKFTYEKRGNRADHDMEYACVDNHYVHISYLQKSDTIAPITGIGIVRRGNEKDGKRPYTVIASSPGTDMLFSYADEDKQEQFHYHWGAKYQYYADDIRAGKEGAPYEVGVKNMAAEWNEGDSWFGYVANPGTEDNWLLPAISRKPLRKDMQFVEPISW